MIGLVLRPCGEWPPAWDDEETGVECGEFSPLFMAGLVTPNAPPKAVPRPLHLRTAGGPRELAVFHSVAAPPAQ